ncbi:MAG: hypothetical protein ABEI80_00015 [Haloplanus sp.]
MNRRQFLAASTTVALAGCLDAFGGDRDGGTDTTRTLRLRLEREATPLRSAYVVDLSETRPARDGEAFRTTLAGDAYTTQYRTPFGTGDDPVYTRHEGTYYRLGSVVVDEAAVMHPVIRLSAVGDPNASEAPDGIDAERLSEFDRRVVHVAHMAARARGNEGGAPWGLVQRGGYVYRDTESVERSRLLGADAPSHVVYRNTVYEIRRTRERFYEPVYRATADPVAETPERMEAILRATFVDARITSAALAAEARSILRTAQDDDYGETHPYSPAYRSVLTALHARAYLDGNIEKDAHHGTPGSGVVQYDDTYYDYRLRFLEK